MEQSFGGQLTLRTNAPRRGAFGPKTAPLWLNLCNRMDESENSTEQIRKYAREAGLEVEGRTRGQLCKDLALFYGETLEEGGAEFSSDRMKPSVFGTPASGSSVFGTPASENPFTPNKPAGGFTSLEDMLKEKKVGGYSDDWEDPKEKNRNRDQKQAISRDLHFGQVRMGYSAVQKPVKHLARPSILQNAGLWTKPTLSITSF